MDLPFKTPAIRRKPMNISQLIALVFFGIIVLGTALLTLPISSRNGVSCGLRVALFTATSSTCVTGLVLRDTWTQWSGFGQSVLLALIEIGGLGFMSMASFFIFTLRKKINMSGQMVIAQSIGAEDMNDTIRLQKMILYGSLSIEGFGAMILTLRFLKYYPFLKALRLGIFHSVSAFCNAGFDILGFEEPGSSMIIFGHDPIILLTLSFLIIIGGLGFLVWNEMIRIRSVKKWTVYTKLVLLTSAVLLFFGTIVFLLTEWHNPNTIGPMSVPQKLLAAFFQSVTTRTAGFDAIGQGALSDAGKAFSTFLMLIGGSSGSTAGGLKTVTFIVMVLFMWSRMRGKDTVSIFRRTIPNRQVMNALTLFCTMVTFSVFGGIFLSATSPVSFTDALYESISALATVGLTTGITPSLSIPAQLLIIVYMYFGRVGILTISLGFLSDKKSEQRFKFAETNLLIG